MKFFEQAIIVYFTNVLIAHKYRTFYEIKLNKFLRIILFLGLKKDRFGVLLTILQIVCTLRNFVIPLVLKFLLEVYDYFAQGLYDFYVITSRYAVRFYIVVWFIATLESMIVYLKESKNNKEDGETVDGETVDGETVDGSVS